VLVCPTRRAPCVSDDGASHPDIERFLEDWVRRYQDEVHASSQLFLPELFPYLIDQLSWEQKGLDAWPG